MSSKVAQTSVCDCVLRAKLGLAGCQKSFYVRLEAGVARRSKLGRSKDVPKLHLEPAGNARL
jgi:hypothetical protein